MKLEEVKELLRIFKCANYKALFGALVLNEKIDYMSEIEDVNSKDIEYLEDLYNKFMESDNLTLINSDLLDDLDDMEED